MPFCPASRLTTIVVTLGEGLMREVQLRDGKATLSAVVDQARRGEPSIITRHGRPKAAILSFEEFCRNAVAAYADTPPEP